MLKNLDLFSGIGMWAYALKEISKTVAYCEIDADCRRVLQNQMLHKAIRPAIIFPDVTRLRGDDIASLKPTSLSASFPCQDISLAHPKGKGLLGLRSCLVYEALRLVDELPSIQVVFMENTPVIVKRGLSTLLSEFTSRGFSVVWGIFSAEDVGAPMIRRRFFAIAYRDPRALPPISPKLMRFDWSREPVPRVVPRINKLEVDSAIKRNRMAGNSLVPQTVVWAYHQLRAVVFGDNTIVTRSTTPLHSITLISDGIVRKFRKPAPFRKMPDTTVLLVDGKTRYSKNFWMSPPASNLWYQYRSITERSTFLLSNQIFWDVRTRKYIESQGDSSFDQRRIDDRWMINPEWVSWLMGHPRKWTIKY